MAGLEQRTRSVEYRSRQRPLSPRQREILIYKGLGLSHREIGDALNMTAGTVGSYVHDRYSGIFVRLGVHDQTNAIFEAINRGEISLEELTEGFNFSRFDSLTRRESEILTMMVHEYGERTLSKQLARDLVLDVKTIDLHLSNIYHKLGVSGWGSKTRTAVLFVAWQSQNAAKVE